MKGSRRFVLAVMAGTAVSVLAAAAQAQGPGIPAGTAVAQCVVGCNMQKKACLQTARADALTCKQSCRDTAAPTDLRACMKGCATTFRGAKDICRTDQKSCIAGCKTSTATSGAPVSSSCLDSCGADLADCAQGVLDAAKPCLSACRTAPDRLTCLADCAAAAETGGQTCASNFEMCSTSCPPAP